MTQRIYFGHPVNFYNTEKESELIQKIQTRFPGAEIENPNHVKHQEGYKRYKGEDGKGNGMDYFFKEVLPPMIKGVFLPFEDGKFGAGVFKEANFMAESGKLIYEISLEGVISEMKIDSSRMLSVEETRERVYGKK